MEDGKTPVAVEAAILSSTKRQQQRKHTKQENKFLSVGWKNERGVGLLKTKTYCTN
jgi:hypothetical protein